MTAGGQWNSYPQKTVDGYNGSCYQEYTCNNTYSVASTTYERNVFVILVVIGVILLVFGLISSAGGEVLTLALSWSGVLSLVVASIRYWSNATKWLQVLILFLALTALIYVAVKKFNKKN